MRARLQSGGLPRRRLSRPPGASVRTSKKRGFRRSARCCTLSTRFVWRSQSPPLATRAAAQPFSLRGRTRAWPAGWD
eukprot:11206967-Lingulodinium_polyedra.AAC.1